MASRTDGIQQLLVAEKAAMEHVQEARRRKARRLKQAKEQAAGEIEAFKQTREKAFQEHASKHMGSKQDVVAKIDQQLAASLLAMQKSVNINKTGVINDLLRLVVDEIKPQLHRNLQRA